MFIHVRGCADLSQTVVRLTAIQERTGNSRSKIYLRVKQRLWPKSVKISASAVDWPKSDVAALNSAQFAAMSADDIRKLVSMIEIARHRTFGWDGQWVRLGKLRLTMCGEVSA